MSFSERLRIARERAGMSQDALAAAAGVTPKTIQRYEGGGEPRLDNVTKIANVLECSIDWLATGEGHPLDGSEDPELNQFSKSHAVTREERVLLEAGRALRGRTGPALYSNLLMAMRLSQPDTAEVEQRAASKGATKVQRKKR